MNGQPLSDSKEKANVLNKHFDSVFTKENISNIPIMIPNNHPLPGMVDINFSIAGIQHQLSLLDMNKAIVDQTILHHLS